MKTKLWQTNGQNLHPLVEKYTVGNDYLYDQKLLGYDIQATMAHVKMLGSVGILKKVEMQKLLAELVSLNQKWQTGKFEILPQMEDGHTAVELYLTKKLGQLGKKVHTGRSRNDQSLVMMRLYLKESLLSLKKLQLDTAKAYKLAAKKAGTQEMPGYTHGQKAMPTTVASWLGSFAEGFSESAVLIESALKIIDQNPLGSAAGFGSNLPLDRKSTTLQLGFKKVQANPMYCGLSRGLFELIAAQSLSPMMVLAGKFANDMLFFTAQEFGFFSLPKNMTTGSSIMPHKQNYDVFEIMKGKSVMFGGYLSELYSLSVNSPSGYTRELQLTKAVVLEAFDTAEETLKVLELVVSKLQINHEKLAAAMSSELNSVDEVDQLVKKGMAFRDAYSQIKKKHI